ncbi:MAG: ribulokinase [Bacteroidota bacterium]|nr:ribulokinase [Bacteroidota bacterium]
MEKKYVIGMDYGSDSARGVLVDANSGSIIATAVCNYPRWTQGLYCVPAENQYRQHPQDYIDAFESVIKEMLSSASDVDVNNIVGISFDTTGSTPALTDENGVPLALLPEYAENPNAMFILWKDHTAIVESDEINELARSWHTDYTRFCGGIYSPEWVWAKTMHVLREDPSLCDAAHSWIEMCDWLPALLAGKVKPTEVVRSRCASGHKALWHESWGGLPPVDFFEKLEPMLVKLYGNLYKDTYTSDYCVGKLSEEWATRLGLTTNVSVGVGAFDCHMGAVGAGIEPNTLVKVIGTSTCDIVISPYDEIGENLIPGICGQVDGSVVPGMVGLEAGQSAFGDIYAWFRRMLSWPLQQLLNQPEYASLDGKLIEDLQDKMIAALTEEAKLLPQNDVVATDWFNGRRTPDANHGVRGSISGMTLATSAPEIFKSLVEATAFGSKAIADRLIENGVKIDSVVALGGISRKSDFVMQTLANVFNMNIKVSAADQACALGAAMFAAVAAGIHPDVEAAQKAMGQGFDAVYQPDASQVEFYQRLYARYKELCEKTENF